MNKLQMIFRWKHRYYFALAVVLVVGGIFMFKNGDTSFDTITVERADFTSQVSVSGKVGQGNDATLGFATSGRIGKIYAESDQSVAKGQMLAQLEIGDLLADLKIKQASYKTSDVDLESDVENAYRLMLSDDLVLTPESETYDLEPPTITGFYEGAEGIYKIIINNDSVNSSDQIISTFNLEKTKRTINKKAPTPLGTKGLYISFGDVLPEEYDGTIWYLDIPNKASASYVVNYNAYIDAKKRLESSAQSNPLGGDASSAVARAEIDKINAEIRKSTIYAPFAGVIINVAKDVGETVSSNENVISMIGQDVFQIEVYVPEVNIAQVAVGQKAKVTLDAYDSNTVFDATIISIDPGETLRDGVSTYKTKLRFDQDDTRIRSGMTANVAIIIFEKSDVLTVPSGVVFEKDGQTFVQIKTENGIIDRVVTTGAVSSAGQVEVLSGLEVGEQVLFNPKTD